MIIIIWGLKLQCFWIEYVRERKRNSIHKVTLPIGRVPANANYYKYNRKTVINFVPVALREELAV